MRTLPRQGAAVQTATSSGFVAFSDTIAAGRRAFTARVLSQTATIDRRRNARCWLRTLSNIGGFGMGCGRQSLLHRPRRNHFGESVMPAQRLRRQRRRAVLRLRRTNPGYRVRVVEIPLVLGDADKVTNGRIACPGLAKRSAGQFGRYAALQ